MIFLSVIVQLFLEWCFIGVARYLTAILRIISHTAFGLEDELNLLTYLCQHFFRYLYRVYVRLIWLSLYVSDWRWLIPFETSLELIFAWWNIYWTYIHCFMQCSLDGNCLDICFDVYFAVWYVISDQNWHSSRSPAFGVINVIKQLMILDIDAITRFDKAFLVADNERIFLHN